MIETLLSYGALIDTEIDQLVNDYIYGDRVTEVPFTSIECFRNDSYEYSERIRSYAVNLKA